MRRFLNWFLSDHWWWRLDLDGDPDRAFTRIWDRWH